MGTEVWSASVPGGYYSRQVARAASEAGYRVLFNSEPNAAANHEGALLILGRYSIQAHTTSKKAFELARADFMPRLTQWVKWNAKKPLKKLGGPAWLAFRKWVLKKSMASSARRC